MDNTNTDTNNKAAVPAASKESTFGQVKMFFGDGVVKCMYCCVIVYVSVVVQSSTSTL